MSESNEDSVSKRDRAVKLLKGLGVIIGAGALASYISTAHEFETVTLILLVFIYIQQIQIRSDIEDVEHKVQSVKAMIQNNRP